MMTASATTKGTRRSLFFGAAILASFMLGSAVARRGNSPVVRIAELEIDPAQLDRYKAAVKEEMEIAVRVEPRVLAIYSVADKHRPNRLWFLRRSCWRQAQVRSEESEGRRLETGSW